jgi:putative transposase
MKYNPEKHHRRSIRLQGYDYSSSGAYFITLCTHQRHCLLGEVIDDEIQLHEFGRIVRAHWLKLPNHHPHLQLDEFVVMPNHIHGILVLTNTSVGAGFDHEIPCESHYPSAKPAPTHPPSITNNPSVQPGIIKYHGIPEIIRGFKTFSARRINQIRNTPGTPVWQRNYYEHIIRNEAALQHIQHYIHTNALSWRQDQLHPDVHSKW